MSEFFTLFFFFFLFKKKKKKKKTAYLCMFLFLSLQIPTPTHLYSVIQGPKTLKPWRSQKSSPNTTSSLVPPVLDRITDHGQEKNYLIQQNFMLFYLYVFSSFFFFSFLSKSFGERERLTCSMLVYIHSECSMLVRKMNMKMKQENGQFFQEDEVGR
jgi:hypothetical protein